MPPFRKARRSDPMSRSRWPPRPVPEPVVTAAVPIVEQVAVVPASVAAPTASIPAAKLPLLDLRSAIASIWAKKFVVLALAGAGAVLGGAVIPLIPQKFTAETSLYFDPRPVGGSDSAQQAPTPPELITTMIDSQTQILSSGKVLGRVVDALKLDQDPKFNGGVTGEAAKYVATAALAKAVQIARESSTYVVNAKVTTGDPQKSAEIANQLVTSFMEEESKAAASTYKNSNTALDSRLEDLRQQVLSAEKAVETYRADNDMVAVEGNLISDKRLTALNDLLVTAQQKTIEARARADAAGKLSFEDVVSNNPSAGVTSTALSSLRQQYATMAANVGSLQSQLGARHPRLLAAKSSLDSLAAEIRAELQRQMTSARADYEQAQKAEQDIAKELAVQKASQVNTSGKLVGLNELQRKATAARNLYESLLKRSASERCPGPVAEQYPCNLGGGTATEGGWAEPQGDDGGRADRRRNLWRRSWHGVCRFPRPVSASRHPRLFWQVTISYPFASAAFFSIEDAIARRLF